MPAAKKPTTKKSTSKKITKKTSAKKPTKKTTAKKAAKTKVSETPKMTDMVAKPTSMVAKRTLNSRALTVALVVTGVALLTYKFGPWLVPAIVDNRPVTRFEIWNRLEKSYGAQTLEDIISEYTLESAINKAGVKADPDKVKEQMDSLEAQFEAIGGLDEALTQRGLTRAELEKQVSTQLAVEEILKDQVQPTEEEVMAYFEDNKETLYLDQEFDDIKDQVKATVSETKLRDAFLTWFAGVKEEAKLKSFGL